MPLEAIRAGMPAKRTTSPSDLLNEKVRALLSIAIMKETNDIFSDSDLSDDNTTMIYKMTDNAVRILVDHVMDGVISSSEFCEMQRAIFRQATELVHNA